MKKVITVLASLFFVASFVFAQEPAVSPAAQETAPAYKEWHKSAVTAVITFSQAGFDNWAGGGENSYAWNAALGGSAGYDGEKIGWQNTLKLKYGMMMGESSGLKKADDEINFESLFKYKFGLKIDPFVSFSWITQMSPGYIYGVTDVEISRFMDPGYFKESLGVVYSPLDNLNVKFGAAVKHTVTDLYTALYAGGVDKVKTEPGAELTADYAQTIFENIILTSKFEAFTNFTTFKAIDMLLDTSINAKVNSFITVALNIVIKYDQDVSVKRQLKNTLTAGLTYSFN